MDHPGSPSSPNENALNGTTTPLQAKNATKVSEKPLSVATAPQPPRADSKLSDSVFLTPATARHRPFPFQNADVASSPFTARTLPFTRADYPSYLSPLHQRSATNTPASAHKKSHYGTPTSLNKEALITSPIAEPRSPSIRLFDENGHLNEEGMALYYQAWREREESYEKQWNEREAELQRQLDETKNKLEELENKELARTSNQDGEAWKRKESLFKSHINDIEKENEAVKQRCSALEEQLTKANADLTDLKIKYDNLSSDNGEQLKQIGTFRTEAGKNNTLISELKKVIKEKEKEITEQEEYSRKELADFQQTAQHKNTTLQKERDDLKKEIISQQEQKRKLAENLKQLLEKNKEINEHNQNLSDKLRVITQERNYFKHCYEEISQAKEQLEKQQQSRLIKGPSLGEQLTDPQKTPLPLVRIKARPTASVPGGLGSTPNFTPRSQGKALGIPATPLVPRGTQPTASELGLTQLNRTPAFTPMFRHQALRTTPTTPLLNPKEWNSITKTIRAFYEQHPDLLGTLKEGSPLLKNSGIEVAVSFLKKLEGIPEGKNYFKITLEQAGNGIPHFEITKPPLSATEEVIWQYACAMMIAFMVQGENQNTGCNQLNFTLQDERVVSALYALAQEIQAKDTALVSLGAIPPTVVSAWVQNWKERAQKTAEALLASLKQRCEL